ncbi:MAG: Trm112 family protein [Candidatus Diapherotrites archaeon]|nr:Trm112 family protein [Candidatus Diapherotrites archaeon]
MALNELSRELLDVLCCPACKGDLDYRKKEQKLACTKCGRVYAIEDGIPVMMVDEG